MSEQKTQVYFIPGMAAGKEIFKNIRLPEDRFEIHVLEWLIPEKNESMVSYASRMAAEIKGENVVLAGVSFGGVVAQEIAAFVNPRKLIIISSVKSPGELPLRLKLARKTGAYKLVPTRLMLSADDLTKFSIGPRSKKRLKLYQDFLHVRDKRYLDWAIKNMVCWQQKEPYRKIIHIHGDKDIIFPIKNINDCVVLEGGTHVMLLNKGKQLSQKLLAVIEE
ncbi:MAG: alpha/beta hydrolase [Bacteroidia bacterium]|nr:alpha/beta hydrolase [Bacteroidia bacterium]NNF31178.1 alpha/beta hydrolase [Flavobacteriaceae bacterium]MBT8274830.1 alpha/beta hydrolase [Bacteroidia bacterium]NNJ81378.1 alpha/beta hydrolase [Flavobacteriaceae bacterium]NNK54608.1 alpha/beta hydrolase [Flavobacteriaceae bacterium]